MTPRVYIASKMHHAPAWRDLYQLPDIHFVSRWPFLEPFVEPSATNARCFWQDDMADVRACHAMIVYALEGEQLRGALVEAGAALALGKLVVVVGDHVDYGTWQHHPNVMRVATLENAIAAIKQYARGDCNG